MNQTSTRYALLDELRGLDLISMMLYHGTWDAVYLFGVAVPWYAGTPGRLWQQSICWGFILLSGFCLPMGHHPVKRGAVVFGAGALVTAVTLLFMPENVVLFGVLTLLGSAMILTGLLEKTLQKVPPVAGFLVSFALFALTYHTMNGYWGLGALRWLLPRGLYANCFTAYLVLPPRLFLHRLLPASAVAVFVLGWILPLPSHRAGADETAAPVGLPAAGVAGAALAGAVPAPSAGHFRSDDGGVFPPAAALSREVEKSAKEP